MWDRSASHIKKGEKMKKIITISLCAAMGLAFVASAMPASKEDAKDKKASLAAPALQTEKNADKTAADDKTKSGKEEAAQAKALTKEEMVSRLNDIFKYHPKIVGTIKGVETKQDEAGNSYYLVNGTKLEDLDPKTLLGILSMANQQISLENLQRIQQQERQQRNLRQLNQLNQLSRMNKNQQSLKQQQAISRINTPKTYSPPKTYTPPKTYKAPPKY
jgi:hypothetical protein